MKKLVLISVFTFSVIFSNAQEIDLTDFKQVAKYYTENFYSGNYNEAMSILVKDGRANGLEIRCVEMNACETQENFTYKLYGEKVSKVENQKRLLVYWTETTYIEVLLEKQENGNWLVVGSPSQPSEKAVQIKG